ncbi:hypothetical protein BDZ89DRAFT_1063882 [Hymenopellis radicata]|nr:hypothetical protein BDZ89DRAFT_1063882 [Hymenopellis radicata]
MTEDPGYMLLGDIAGSVRYRAYVEVLSRPNHRQMRSFDAVNRLSDDPNGLSHILAGPWLDVDAAVEDLMYQIMRTENLADSPRNLLLEDDSSPDHRTHDIVKNARIASMIASFRNLTVVVLANLDFTKGVPDLKSDTSGR